MTQRTGHQVLIVTAKSTHDSYARAGFHVSMGAEKFVEETYGSTPAELAHLFEAFAVNGGAKGMSWVHSLWLRTSTNSISSIGVAKTNMKLYNTVKTRVSERLNLLLREYLVRCSRWGLSANLFVLSRRCCPSQRTQPAIQVRKLLPPHG